MPYLCNDIPKPYKKTKYRVTNWAEYNNAVRNRGDVTIWLSDEGISQLVATKSDYQGKGRPRKFSDIAIHHAEASILASIACYRRLFAIIGFVTAAQNFNSRLHCPLEKK